MTKIRPFGQGSPLKSFRTKTIIVVLAILGFWLSLGVKFVIDFQTEQMMREVDRDSRFLVLSIAEDIQSAVERGEKHSGGNILSNASMHEKAECVCLADSNRKVVSTTHPGLLGTFSYELTDVSEEDMFHGQVVGKDTEALESSYVYSQSMRLDNTALCSSCHITDGPILGWLTVTVGIDHIMEDIATMKKTMILGGLAFGLLLTVSISIFLTRSVNRPLESLAETMKRAEDDFDVRFEMPHDNELKVLANGFNNLMKNLSDARNELESAYHTELYWYHKELEDTVVQLEKSNEQLDEKLKKLATLMDVGRVISTYRKPDDLMNIILDASAGQIGVDRGSIMHYEQRLGELIVVKGTGLSPEHRRKNRFKLGEGVAGWSAANKEAAIVNDTATDERFVPGRSGPSNARILTVPLISSKGEVLGVLSLERDQGREKFGMSDLEYLLAITGNSSVALENAGLLQNLQKSYYDTISALAMTVEAKDPYTLGHSKRVTQYAMVVGEEMGLSEEALQTLQYGATLHDIGKIGIAESILNKKGKLDDHEFREIMSHAEKGEAIIAGVDFLQPTRQIIRNHQEYYDGTGYPDGLKGEEIPLEVAIVGISDFYDALTTDRPYRKAFSHEQAVDMVREESGRKLNPRVVEAFLKIFEEPER